jgi:hypothetical protein
MMCDMASTPGADLEAGNAGSGEHGSKPQRHSGIEAMLEQISVSGPGAMKNTKIQGPVVEAVVELVSIANFPLRRVFDGMAGTKG